MEKNVQGGSGGWLLASAIALLSSVTGCSLIFVEGPASAKDRTAWQSPQCTTSRAAPVVDTVIGGLQVIRTGYAMTADDSVYEGFPISREADIALGAGLTTLFVSSALYGYSVTGRCRELTKRGYRMVEEPAE